MVDSGIAVDRRRAVVEDEFGLALTNLVGLLKDLPFLPEFENVLL